MADHLVHRREQIFRILSEPAGTLHFLRGSGKLVRHRRVARARDGVAASEQQEILRAEFFADLVFVGEVVADRVHVKVAGFNQYLDRLHDRRLKRLFLVLRVPRGLLLEVGGVLSQLDHGVGDRLVRDGHETLRAPLGAARVAIHFNEAVGEIDLRVIAHPVGAEQQPIFGIARLVEANQTGDRLRLRRIGNRSRLFQKADRLLQIDRIQAGRDLAVGRAGTIDLFPDPAVRALRDSGIQRELFVKVLQVLERHAAIERVRAALQDVFAWRRRLRRRNRLDIRIEQGRRQLSYLALHVGRRRQRPEVAIGGCEPAVLLDRQRRLEKLVGREGRQELLPGGGVVVAAVRPEKQGVIPNRPKCCRRDAGGPGDDFLEQPLLAQPVRRELVINNRIDGNRCLHQPIRQRLMPRVEIPETVGLKLDEPRITNALDNRAGWRVPWLRVPTRLGPALTLAVRLTLSPEATPLSAGEGRQQARDQRDQKH